MRNHNATVVAGKEMLEINFFSGKEMTPNNVFHVPDIRKNLVSTNLIYKNGFKIVVEATHVLYRRKRLLWEKFILAHIIVNK